VAYGINLLVWGDYASFNRPEMKVERVTYDVITPSAARGILEAIYWKPEMRWVIDRLYVLNPLRFTHIRRNEVNCKLSARNALSVMKEGEGELGIAVEGHRQQRAAMVLKDVCYGIEAHVEVIQSENRDGRPLEAPEAKHLRQFKDRALKGACFHRPYLGTREFPASFRLVDGFTASHPSLIGTNDLGFMLHDIAFIPDVQGKVVEANQGRRLRAEPRFFPAIMRNGIIDVPYFEAGREPQ
jgi:CRISPR-associated protein Cas5d